MTHTVQGRARIPLPLADCWEKLRDFERAKDYVPGLVGVRVTTEAQSGLGASRVVSHGRFGDTDETVIEWTEGRGFRIRLHRGSEGPAPPFREASFRYALEPVAESETDIVTTMEYEVAFGVLGAVLNALFLKRFVGGSVRDVALALAENYQTDAPVPSERLAELRRA